MRRAPQGDQPALEPGLEPTPEPTAGDLVASWCRGYSNRRGGAQPHPSVLKRVAGQCKAIGRDCGDSRDAWVQAWHAAAAAGRDGKYDITLYLADFRPVHRTTVSAEQRVRAALLGTVAPPTEIGE